MAARRPTFPSPYTFLERAAGIAASAGHDPIGAGSASEPPASAVTVNVRPEAPTPKPTRKRKASK